MEKQEILVVERQFLKENAERLRKKHPGRFLLIKGRRVHGAFASHDEAVSAGVKRFPAHQPFLVRSVEDVSDPVLDNIALSQGIPLSCPY